jgi:chaperone BCS1
LISSPGDNPDESRLRLFYDSKRTQKVTINDQSVTVSLEQASFDFSKMNSNERFTLEDRVMFTCHSPESRAAVVVFLREIVAQRAKSPPRLFSLRWGAEWSRISDVAYRSIESVVLRTGQREALVEDLERFLGQQADYARLGVPWHRGYLFSGIPGTGKSSIAGVLASHFGLDVYFLPLGSVKDDSDLVRIFAGIQPRSMLVLEDVDVLHASRQRENDSGVTMAGLLNCLDGMLSPSGMIVCMTSNHADVLDDAILRPGRVDMRLDFDYLDADQLVRLLKAFMGRVPTLPPLTARITPADVVDVLKRHLEEPLGAVKELAALVCQK